MIKRIYWLKVNSKNLDETDPNIDIMFQDIKWGLSEHKGEFEFQIKILLNGFIETNKFEKVINLFVSDLVSEGTSVHGAYTWEQCGDCLRRFIKNYYLAPYKERDREKEYAMEAIFDHNQYSWSVRFSLPKTLLSEGKHEEMMALGPEALLTVLSPAEAIEYFLPFLYHRLDQKDLDKLDDSEYRNLWKYQMGLA